MTGRTREQLERTLATLFAVVIGFGAGFIVHLRGVQQDMADLEQHRAHAKEVAMWESWLADNSPFIVLPNGKKIAAPQVLQRGRAELSADYSWPRPTHVSDSWQWRDKK